MVKEKKRRNISRTNIRARVIKTRKRIKNMRGKGIARKMLEEFFKYVGKITNYIALETLTESNVPIYEHFGFTVKDTFQTKNGELKEYRMLKKIDDLE